MSDERTHDLYERFAMTPQQQTRMRLAGFVIFHPDDFPPDAQLGYDRATGEMVALEPVGRRDGTHIQGWRFPAAVSAQEEP